MSVIFENLLNFNGQMLVMWIIGGVLIYLAIKKDMEPTLLLPIGFGTIVGKFTSFWCCNPSHRWSKRNRNH